MARRADALVDEPFSAHLGPLGQKAGALFGLSAFCLCPDRISRCWVIRIGSKYGISAEQTWNFQTSEIRTQVEAVANDAESGIPAEKITTDRIGRILSKMRFRKASRPSPRDPRQWEVGILDIHHWLAAYAMPIPTKLKLEGQDPHFSAHAKTNCASRPSSGTSGTSGYNDTDESHDAVPF